MQDSANAMAVEGPEHHYSESTQPLCQSEGYDHNQKPMLVDVVQEGARTTWLLTHPESALSPSS